MFSPFVRTTFSFLKSSKKVILFFIILSLPFYPSLRAQDTYRQIDLTFKTANYSQADSLLIQIQVARDKEFTNLVHESEWIKCKSGKEFTYSMQIPLIQGSFYWKGRHKDPVKENISDWSSPYRFYLLLDLQAVIPGDSNGDSLLNMGDLVYLVKYLFAGGPLPTPLQTGDLNCDEKISTADLIYLLNYLFKSGPSLCTYFLRPKHF